MDMIKTLGSSQRIKQKYTKIRETSEEAARAFKVRGCGHSVFNFPFKKVVRVVIES